MISKERKDSFSIISTAKFWMFQRVYCLAAVGNHESTEHAFLAWLPSQIRVLSCVFRLLACAALRYTLVLVMRSRHYWNCNLHCNLQIPTPSNWMVLGKTVQLLVCCKAEHPLRSQAVPFLGTCPLNLSSLIPVVVTRIFPSAVTLIWAACRLHRDCLSQNAPLQLAKTINCEHACLAACSACRCHTDSSAYVRDDSPAVSLASVHAILSSLFINVLLPSPGTKRTGSLSLHILAPTLTHRDISPKIDGPYRTSRFTTS